jgi:large subunit ribosomal protein L44e
LKIPKELRTYCPKCHIHTLHVISIYKKGKERRSSQGARHHEQDKKGYGGQKFPELIRTAKTTKKVLLRFKCKQCNRTLQREGIRLRKAEIIEK